MEKKIVITGTSRGLGRALAERFSELGHHVFGGARTPFEQLPATPPGHYHRLDVTDDSSHKAWWAEIVSVWGGLPDIVLANAAVINANAPLWEVPPDQFRAVLEANVVGVYLTFKHFLNLWHEQSREERRPAVLVAFSSGWGRSTSPEVGPYCASKWAIEGMAGSLSQEVPPEVAVIALNPGIIDTEMLRSCFGEGAGHYSKPAEWAVSCASKILQLGGKDNGASI